MRISPVLGLLVDPSRDVPERNGIASARPVEAAAAGAFITEPTVMETTSSLPPEEELGLVGIDVGMGCHEPSSRKTPRVAMA